MITFPNAKINIGLDIVARRADDYHDIETVFYPIKLCDALEIVPARSCETTLTCHGRAVDCPVEKNLVYRAYSEMREHYDLPPVEIHLVKHIPDGAGLGGGSSDAAHAMTMLNEMFNLGASNEELAKLALTIGADCPFFIYNRPMLATGVGERLSPIDLSLQGKTLLLIKPEVYVSTREAYAGVTPARPALPLVRRVNTSLNQWQGNVSNAFEPSVFAAHPTLETIKRQLLDNGAVYAAMSGSGSSIFGIFDNDKVAHKLHDTMGYTDSFVMPL